MLLASSATRLGWVVATNTRMLSKRVGALHARLGVLHAALIAWRYTTLWLPVPLLAYHVALGAVGVALPLTAAAAFGHHGIRNVASGALDPHATVTHDEMVEHAFYQGLLLVQVLFLHLCSTSWLRALPTAWRLGCVLLPTAPWLLRSRFPVNHFSDNYVRVDERSTSLIRLLYRVKKAQYVVYKHFLLHAVNVAAALGHFQLTDVRFDFFWLVLNHSYVMEFFLQTLVRE